VVSLSRRNALLLAGGVTAAVLVGAIVWFASSSDGERAPALSGSELLVAGTSLEPQGHLFGARVTARLDIVYDPAHVRADSIVARPRFAPYTVVGRRESRDSFGDVARVRQEYVLDCLRARCLAPKRGFFAFPDVKLQYATTFGPGLQPASGEWPRLRVASRTGSDELESLRVRADVRDLPAVTYRVRPGLVAAVGYALAFVLALAGVVLLAYALSARRLLTGVAMRRRARSPLERALALVRRSTARGEVDGSRRALERLAAELRRTEEADLAQTATRLAWRRAQPSGTAVDPLSTDVERVISEDGR
jgi:hypothetical protein